LNRLLISSLTLLAVLPLHLGCSSCRYDFVNPTSPKSPTQTLHEMGDCYTVATKGINVPTSTDEQHDAAAQGWMSCMAERGYKVVKR
jgi:hypothetical protein